MSTPTASATSQVDTADIKAKVAQVMSLLSRKQKRYSRPSKEVIHKLSTGLEQETVQVVTGLLALAVTAGIGWATRKVAPWLKAHTNAKTAVVATTAIDGLSKIAESVVQDFNQRIVTDAKKNGV